MKYQRLIWNSKHNVWDEYLSMEERIANNLTKVYFTNRPKYLNSLCKEDELKKVYQDGLRAGYLYGSVSATKRETKDEETFNSVQHHGTGWPR